MGANAAWRVTGFVLRVSSWLFLACFENDWRIAVRQNSGRFGLLDFILDGYFRVSIYESRGLVST